MAHDVFISHSSKDKVVADMVVATLERAGLRCWVAPRDILPGASWARSIVEAINGCKAMVVVFSAHANESRHVSREVERAASRGAVIVPLRIENVLPAAELEYFLSSSHWMDAITPPVETHLRALAEMLKIVPSIQTPARANSSRPTAATGRPKTRSTRASEGVSASRPSRKRMWLAVAAAAGIVFVTWLAVRGSKGSAAATQTTVPATSPRDFVKSHDATTQSSDQVPSRNAVAAKNPPPTTKVVAADPVTREAQAEETAGDSAAIEAVIAAASVSVSRFDHAVDSARRVARSPEQIALLDRMALGVAASRQAELWLGHCHDAREALKSGDVDLLKTASSNLAKMGNLPGSSPFARNARAAAPGITRLGDYARPSGRFQ